jgi:cytochrome c553
MPPAVMRLPVRLIGSFVAAGLLLPLCISCLGAQPLEDRLPACFACHGKNGQSQLPDVPSLGAQPRFYALIQLVLFRDKLRVFVPMNEMLSGLADDELRKAADLIGTSPPPQPPVEPEDRARMERARELASKHRCDFCHQANFEGHDNVPRLAGQREDYLLKALRSYKDNSRYAYDAQMADVVYPLQDRDFVELAYFLARSK